MKGCFKGCLSSFLLMLAVGVVLDLIDKWIDADDVEEKVERKVTPEKGAKEKVAKERGAGKARPSQTSHGPERKETVEEVLAELDALVGLEGVKAEVRRIVTRAKIDAARAAEGIDGGKPSYHMVFTGNPGTGKTTVARLVARAFAALGLVPRGQLVEVDRADLIGQYAGETAVKASRKIEEAKGGILFIDEAYQLVSGENDTYGKEAVATLLKRMEDGRDSMIVIAAGYTDEMRDFLASNPGLKSRFARQIEFDDYSAAELATIFRTIAKKNTFTLAPDLEESLDAAMEKLTRKRDRTFGNARFVRQLYEDSVGRQAERLAGAGTLDRQSLTTLTLADLGLGEKALDTHAPTIEEVLAELDQLTGLDSVKTEVRRLIATCRARKLREEKGLASDLAMSYNFVFTGNPGTGKTTVARILGKAFRALGLLERGNFVETDRSGLVAAYSGQTALKTNKLIDSAMGGVLFIDEAYQLNAGENDTYGREALATLLKRIEDARGSIVVIVAGYKEEMKRFLDANSGLDSRFDRKIEFPDYSPEDLAEIFRSMARKAHYVLSADTDHWLRAYISVRTKNRDKNFGNARWARNLFERAVERQAERVVQLTDPTPEELTTLILRDVGISLKDPDASTED